MADAYCSRVSYETGKLAVYFEQLALLLAEIGYYDKSEEVLDKVKVLRTIALATFEETPPVGVRVEPWETLVKDYITTEK